MNIPLLIGHRGYPERYPENTLCGLEAAAAAGACWVEVDVQLTRDLVPLVIHDASLQRTAGRPGSVMDMEHATVRDVTVDERQRFGKAFVNAGLPTLAQVAAWAAGHPALGIFVEIKRASLVRFGRTTVLERVLQALSPILERVVVISFDFAAVQLAARYGAPHVGWVIENWNEESLAMLRELSPGYAFCDHVKVPAAQVLPSGPWQWALYDIVDPQLALDWARRGASLIESWAVAEMLAHPILGRRACGG